ncbi:MAG: efflux RND transporter periplasmic adaptor subunit [Xanthomonadales bacterium]|nr:efflux RND transporter periplasmic adaptor subunit [Xanthomonadales bacterium]
MSRTRISTEEMRRLLGETVAAPPHPDSTRRMERSFQSTSPSRHSAWGGVQKAALAVLVIAALYGVWQWQEGRLILAAAPNSQSEDTVAVETETSNVASVGLNNEVPASDSVLDASGYVNAVRLATVSSVTTGRLEEVLVREGSRVTTGQLLARLDSKDIQRQVSLAEAQLVSAQSMLKQQQVQHAEAQDQHQRIARLHQQGFASDDELTKADFAVSRLAAAVAVNESEVVVAERRLSIHQQQLLNTNIYAPFDGLVIDRAAEVGEIVSPVSAGGGFTRTGIFTLVDTSSIEAHVKVNESYIGRIQKGQAVTITPRSYPDLQLKGEVSTIMPAAEKETASVKVIVTFLDHDERILPNMSVDLSFNEGEQSGVSAADLDAALAHRKGAL